MLGLVAAHFPVPLPTVTASGLPLRLFNSPLEFVPAWFEVILRRQGGKQVHWQRVAAQTR